MRSENFLLDIVLKKRKRKFFSMYFCFKNKDEAPTVADCMKRMLAEFCQNLNNTY